MEEENRRLKAEIEELRSRLRALEEPGVLGSAVRSPHAAAGARDEPAPPCGARAAPPAATYVSPHGLTKHQAERYSRQIVLPSFGPAAQARLCSGSALIVGCGGLGAPAALYLAAAGVGRLGLVDHDLVEISNLHRQIIHSEARAGTHKAESAAAAVRALNSAVVIDTHADGLRPGNAVQIVSRYDVILDCSDNAPTRYLLSDAAAACGRPLVSAAAVGTDGQLTVYCHGDDGPCYRCLFPEPPAPGNCARCADAGVLGPVPGVMGVLQALEAVKILTGVGKILSRQLLLFDALAGRFTSVKLRARAPGCAACGCDGGGGVPAGGEAAGAGAPAGGGNGGSSGSGGPRGRMRPGDVAAYDYTAFTGQRPDDGPPPPLRVLPPEQRLSPAALAARLAGAPRDGAPGGCVLVDVRPREQFEAAALPGWVSVPFGDPRAFRERGVPRVLELCSAAAGTGAAAGSAAAEQEGRAVAAAGGAAPARAAVYVLCRRGNHSQLAVQALREAGLDECYDLAGGLQAWAAEVDPSMPVL